MMNLTNPSPSCRLPLQPGKLSRRALSFVGPTLPLLLAPFSPSLALAQSDGEDATPGTASSQPNPGITQVDLCRDPPISPKKAFLDVSIDGAPAGRIIIGLYGDAVPLGSSRFAAVVSGATGISYRRKEFIKIMPNYVQHAGLSLKCYCEI